MTYRIELTPQAEDDLSHLDRNIAQNIVDKIDWLSHNIESIIPLPLKGKFKGKFKLRVGDWRVVYAFEHTSQIVTLYAIKHRREVYKV